MKVELTRTYRFEAAHLLPNVPEGHKCRRLHGHSFVIDVTARGDVDERVGWFVDYADIDAEVAPLRDALDHRYLNDIEGLENPTSEILAAWLWKRLESRVPGLWKVTVHETCNAECAYYGPDEPSGKEA